MRASDAWTYGGLGGSDRRRIRTAPTARLWPSRRRNYPGLYPSTWYRLHSAAPRDPRYLWLETAHGLIRVERVDVEVRAGHP